MTKRANTFANDLNGILGFGKRRSGLRPGEVATSEQSSNSCRDH